jgi:RNA-directed DNA polymerase
MARTPICGRPAMRWCSKLLQLCSANTCRSHACTHIKGHGGAKFAVREVRDHLAANRFVLRTDVKSYYASIDHLMLLDQLAVHIKDRRVLNLVGQYLRRTSERGGSFWHYEKGISLGCPLSPLIGAFFLNAPDAAAAKLRLFYVRFMDDILILAPSHWQLRRAVKVVNQTLGVLSLGKHPDKTFLGRIERGFDFLGYHFSLAGLTVAKKTIANFIENASRLYEQKRSAVSAATALEMYVRRWVRWTVSGKIGRSTYDGTRWTGRPVHCCSIPISTFTVKSKPVHRHNSDPA